MFYCDKDRPEYEGLVCYANDAMNGIDPPIRSGPDRRVVLNEKLLPTTNVSRTARTEDTTVIVEQHQHRVCPQSHEQEFSATGPALACAR